MLRLLTFLIPHRKLVAALVLANFALSGLLIVTPLVIKAIVDDVIGGSRCTSCCLIWACYSA